MGKQRKKKDMKKLIHYSTTLPLIVVCDTSLYGILDILSHKYPDISEGPIVKACRSLSPAEKKYSQIEEKSLAIIATVKKLPMHL